MPKATILIRALNEEEHLESTLKSIYEQSFKDFEVLLVDSGSTDRTLDIASRFPVRIVSIEPREFTYGRALNLGCREARGDFVVLLSAHALPAHDGWLRALLEPFQEIPVAGVMGRELPRSDCNPFDRRGLQSRYDDVAATDLDLNSGIGFGAANSAIRRTVWEKHPFDEELTYAEDWDWGRRVLGSGHRLRYAPDAAAYHSHNESLARIERRFYNEAAAHRKLGLNTASYGVVRLFLASLLVPIYDKAYVLAKRDHPKWLVWAPFRRWAMNLGRYKGYRGIDPEAGLITATVIRLAVAFTQRMNRVLSDRSATLVRWTGKSSHAIHPKHLAAENPDRDWYLEQIEGSKWVLDAGCSYGGHTLRASRAASMIVGFDYNRAHLELASRRAHEEGRKNVAFHMADAERPWPHKSSSFDCVLALDILEHLNTRRAFLEECLRVLKPDGALLLAVPNRETSWKQLQKRVGLSYFSDPDHKVEYSREELERELTDSGFRIVSLTPVVYDTRWYGFIDLMGGVSKSAYDRLSKWKRRVAMERPEESNGFRVVAHP